MKIPLDKKTRQSGAWLLFDLFMVGVASINILWILFDWLYASAHTQSLAIEFAPWFHEFYLPIHHNFIQYDVYFVIFFLFEFSIRWAISIIRSEYYKWFFYPFAHWYDLLGCIPIGGFRWLRVLRLVVVVTRLQRLGIIQMQNWTITHWAMKYYEIFVEEVSDRVVVNVIGEVQSEIRDGHSVSSNIREKVIDPHKAQLIEIVIERTQRVIEKNYDLHQPSIEKYVREITHHSAQSNPEMKRIQKMPVFGNLAVSTIENTISDVVLGVIDKIVTDFADVKNFAPIEAVVDDAIDGISTQGQEELERIVSEILIESLELVKARVEVQRWKTKYKPEQKVQ